MSSLNELGFSVLIICETVSQVTHLAAWCGLFPLLTFYQGNSQSAIVGHYVGTVNSLRPRDA